LAHEVSYYVAFYSGLICFSNYVQLFGGLRHL
jgi:hypothetical protein